MYLPITYLASRKVTKSFKNLYNFSGSSIWFNPLNFFDLLISYYLKNLQYLGKLIIKVIKMRAKNTQLNIVILASLSSWEQNRHKNKQNGQKS